MHFKQTLLIAAMSAAGAMGQASSLLSDFASLTSELGGLTSAYSNSDLSIFAVIATALPPSLVTAITDPAVQSSLSSEFKAGNTPSWYSALPADVKSYINSVGSQTSDLPFTSAVSSLEASFSSVRSSVSSQVSAASQSAVGSSTSQAGAPVPTAAIVASMAGVVGVLALAIGL